MTREKLIERIKKECILKLSEGIDNSTIEDIQNNSAIKDNELMIQFAKKYGTIIFNRIEKISKDKLAIQIAVSASPQIISEWSGDENNVVGIAVIYNASGRVERFFMNENEIFFNSKAEIIANNEDSFFEYLFKATPHKACQKKKKVV